MTDVRLTATNPEDSSVVPVACNAKGELLLEEPTINSDNYVAKTGDNMTGDLTLGTDKITLDATDGSAEFAGDVVINSVTVYGNVVSKTGVLADQRITAGNTLAVNSSTIGLSVGSTNGALIYTDGSVKFAKSVYVNDSSDSGFLNYTNANKNSYINLGPDAGTAGVKLTCKTDTNSTDSIFYVFNKNDVGKPPTVSINANGSGLFAGDVVVGSRNKKWMLVEQGGLCHMVENISATTMATAAQYPPLRDVIAELNAVEKALGEVMEKLRMKPPAGWEVWDGSDEN